MTERMERVIRWALVVFFAIMATGYNLGPILEGPDEPQHTYYVHYLVTEGRLPERDTQFQVERWELHQAPLYYMIGALIRLPVSDDDYDFITNQSNTYFDAGPRTVDWFNTLQPGNYNKNRHLHGPAEEFPYDQSGTAMAAHLLRLYSSGLGLLTAVTCAAIYRLLWPDQPAYRLLALGITCAWPQFQYLSGVINNDNMATLTATWCVYQCLRFQENASWRTAGLIGLGLGAALIAKANGVLLILPIGLAYALSERRHLPKAGLTIAIAAAVAGWWLALNVVNYGDPTGLRAQYLVFPGNLPPGGTIRLETMPARWFGIYQTLWASFGAFNLIKLAGPEYLIYNTVVTVSAAGLVLGAARLWKRGSLARPLNTQIRQVGVLIAMGAVWIAALSVFLFTHEFGRLGRLLLPCMAVWSAGLAQGILVWVPDRFREKIALGVMAIMAVLSVSALATFHAAYRPTPMPTRIESARDFIYDQTVQLVGVSQDTITARPGETVEFSLYWRSLKSTDRHILIDIHTYGDVGGDLIDINSYPGTGNWPSLNWLPDQYWAERYRVEIPSTAQPGAPVPIVVYLFYPDEQNLLPIIGQGNRPVMFPEVMQIRIVP